MRIDDQDRIWVTEYRGNKVAMFDPQDGEVRRVSAAAAHLSVPLRRRQGRRDLDRRACIPTASWRYDPKTNPHGLEYPLPNEPPISAACGSTTPRRRPTFWTGSNHGAALVKVEPLD
jgi:hypothetical protein